MEATRRACRNVNKDSIKKVENINRKIHKVVKDGRDRKDLLIENYDFHFAIYRESKSKILLPMIESLWLQCGPFTYYSLLSPRDLWDAKFHDDIIEALKSGNEDAAAKAVKSDIVNTAKFLKEHGHYDQPKLRRVMA